MELEGVVDAAAEGREGAVLEGGVEEGDGEVGGEGAVPG